ncbi:xanthine dehydrogenase family protein molybdopterin-binding subunit [Elongatibacter sediminis]|uniref:Molybdopterin cofactor-binding domain-containing protein n=1 Tax=Elongatibacter sediminis TaxID=3119006 RepID=A0AAW9R940_9GAMM
MTVEKITRRSLLKSAGATGGLLVLGVYVPVLQAAVEADDAAPVFVPNVFVAFQPDGQVIITVSRSEMGQGVRTSLPRIVADELEADLEKITLQQAVGHPRYGDQNTDGSKSVRLMFDPLRRAGAAARMMFEQAAADYWNVPVVEVQADRHEVRHKRSEQRRSYAELLPDAARLPVPTDLRLKHPSQFRYIGQPASGVDLPDIVTGRAKYGYDVRIPGMKYACVARAPVFDARVVDYTPDEAIAVPGVSAFYRIPYSPHTREFRPEEGIAVVADNSWSAIRGRDALQVDWDLGQHADHATDAYREALRDSVQKPGTPHLRRGDIELGLEGSGPLIDATYETAMLAHAPMEPPVATAWVREDGSCEIWAPVQDAGDTRRLVAEWLDVEPDQVTVNVTLLGGGFGRKSQFDFVLEAVEVSRQAGAPVKLLWTREDDIRNDYFHAESVQRMTARLGPDGVPNGWRMRAAYPSIDWMWEPGLDEPMPWELGMGWTNMPFDVPVVSVEGCKAPIPIRIGWLRSVCNVWHAFSINSFVDELAFVAGRDPVEYRLRLLNHDREFPAPNEPRDPLESFNGLTVDTGRYRNVLEQVAVRAGWGKPLPINRFRGIAAHNSFYSYAASVVEIEIQPDASFRIVRVDTAVDCGRIVNPEGVIQQIEGATIFGLSLALYGELTASGGRVEQSNFHDYRLMRIDEAPPVIKAWLVNSDHPPSGIGEPPTPTIAPALAGAMHAATGYRFRKLPLLKEWDSLRAPS